MQSFPRVGEGFLPLSNSEGLGNLGATRVSLTYA